MEAGVQIKIQLLENRLTQAWLLYQFKRLGISLDKSVLCDVLSGRRKGPKSDEVIRNAELILKRYKETYERSFTA